MKLRTLYCFTAVTLITLSFPSAGDERSRAPVPACERDLTTIYDMRVIGKNEGHQLINYNRHGFEPSQYLISDRGMQALLGEDDQGRELAAFIPRYPKSMLDVFELRNKRVLDVGTGGGRLVNEFRAAGITAFGVDINLTPAQAKLAYFIRADAIRIPFPDKSFDVIYSNYSILLYEENKDLIISFLREFRRLLSEDGSIRLIPLRGRQNLIVSAAECCHLIPKSKNYPSDDYIELVLAKKSP